ncbi:MAG: LysR family transcriptional regulator, partial [Bacteriovoracia bacterium]
MPKLNFTLTQIEYVLSVEKYGQFARAAKACFITQPTLSMQVQRLEENLGFVLFDRAKKPVRATDRARPVLAQMKLILHEVRKLEEQIHGRVRGPLSGELTVAVIPTLAPSLLPRLLPRLRRRLPNLDLDLREMQTPDIIQALNRDEIDLAIVALSLGSPQISERPLFWEPLSVVCGKEHPLRRFRRIKPQNLSPEDIWLLEEGHCLRTQMLDLCGMKGRRDAGSNFRLESGSLETLKNLVDTVGGYTLAPYLAT